MRSSVSTVRTSAIEHGTHSSSGFSNLLISAKAHFVIGNNAAIVALGGFIQLDGEVLDRGGLELLGDAPLHVTRGLSNLRRSACALSAME